MRLNFTAAFTLYIIAVITLTVVLSFLAISATTDYIKTLRSTPHAIVYTNNSVLIVKPWSAGVAQAIPEDGTYILTSLSTITVSDKTYNITNLAPILSRYGEVIITPSGTITRQETPGYEFLKASFAVEVFLNAGGAMVGITYATRHRQRSEVILVVTLTIICLADILLMNAITQKAIDFYIDSFYGKRA